MSGDLWYSIVFGFTNSSIQPLVSEFRELLLILGHSVRFIVVARSKYKIWFSGYKNDDKIRFDLSSMRGHNRFDNMMGLAYTD